MHDVIVKGILEVSVRKTDPSLQFYKVSVRKKMWKCTWYLKEGVSLP